MLIGDKATAASSVREITTAAELHGPTMATRVTQEKTLPFSNFLD